MKDGASCGDRAYFEGRDGHALLICWNVAGPPGDLELIESAIQCLMGWSDWLHLPVGSEWRFVCLRCGMLNDRRHRDWKKCTKYCFIYKKNGHPGEPCQRNNWAQELYSEWGIKKYRCANLNSFEKKIDNGGQDGPRDIPAGMNGERNFHMIQAGKLVPGSANVRRAPASSSARALSSHHTALSSSSLPTPMSTSGPFFQSNFSGGRGRGVSVHSQSIACARATDVPATFSSAAGLRESNRTALPGPFNAPASIAPDFVSRGRGRGWQPPNQ